MATIVDVAQRASVGVGTVSRVLNDSPLVSDPTRKRVLQAIDELNYRPSSLARGLSRGTTNTIGVVVPSVTTPSAMERLRGIVDVTNESGHDVLLFNVADEGQRAERIDHVGRPDRTVGGILISLKPTADDLRNLLNRAAPVVTIDGRLPGVPGFFIDDRAGGRIATEHLLSLGHRRIAFVGDLEYDLGFSPGKKRLEGYRIALGGAGISAQPELVKIGEHSRLVAERLTRELFELESPPTAIVATSDVQAIGVIEASRRSGRRVPEELSVVGFDDLELASYVGLTTVRQPLYESGRRGAKLLLELLADPAGAGEPTRLPIELVDRHTSAPPAQVFGLKNEALVASGGRKETEST